MAHKITMVMDWQYGSTGKGLIAGKLATEQHFDTVTCSFATNAGHTFIDDGVERVEMMTQQLPTGIVSKSVKTVLIGPGALIHIPTLAGEIERYFKYIDNKQIIIHPHAAIVTDEHAEIEQNMGMSKIGSTTKGVGAAMIQRIRRDPAHMNVAVNPIWSSQLSQLPRVIVDESAYRDAMEACDSLLIEGAQGFSLSMYHGQYPYTTSRDVTPLQILADCAVPFKKVPYVNVVAACRTYPIRVNNRDGNSGPCYPDQTEVDWGIWPHLEPEKTTVTKLRRRIFTFSRKQFELAAYQCGGYWHTDVFLNFANYCVDGDDLTNIVNQIERPSKLVANPPKVKWFGFGPTRQDVFDRDMIIRRDWNKIKSDPTELCENLINEAWGRGRV